MYMRTCVGEKWDFALILLEFYVRFFFIYILVSLFICCSMYACVCAHAQVLMCVEAIETVLQHTAWCLQPASCHKQSAPASVKQQAWENRALYRLQPPPRSLNRPTHLPNALRSKWAMGVPCDFEIVAWQQVGEGRGGDGRCSSLTLTQSSSRSAGGKRAGFVGHVSDLKRSSFRLKWFHTWMWLGCGDVW